MVNQHWFAVVSLCVLLALFVCSIPGFLDSNIFRVHSIQLYQGPAGNLEIQDLIQSQEYVPLQKGKSRTGQKEIWIKIQVPQEILEKHQGIVTVFSMANMAPKEMKAYHLNGDTITLLADCSNDGSKSPCMSRSSKAFFQFQPQNTTNQWLYIKMVRESELLFHQFYFDLDDPSGKISEKVLYLIALMHGIFFLYFMIGIVFSIAFRDWGLLYFGLLFLCFFITTQLSRSTPFTVHIDHVWMTRISVLLSFLLVALKLSLILSLFDLRKISPRVFFLGRVLTFFSIACGIFALFPIVAILPNFIQLPFLTFCLLTMCVLLIYVLTLKIPFSLDISTALFIGILCSLVWSLHRSGYLMISWITDLYPMIGEAASGWLLLSLIFVRINTIVSERKLVQFRIQESRMAKSLLRALSHDLSNTTQVIISNSHLIEMNANTSKPIDKYLNRIVTTAEVQGQIINHFKNSYMIRGAANVQLNPTHLLTSLHSAVETFRENIQGKMIDIQIKCSDENLHVLAEDSSLRHHVLSNLLSNAIKYSPQKGIISFEISESKNGLVKIELTDQGSGISPEILGKIFDERVQLYKFERTEEGTGFGLLIVQDFIKSYGGEIHFENYPNDRNPEGLKITMLLTQTPV